jgi:hypothetical protein
MFIRVSLAWNMNPIDGIMMDDEIQIGSAIGSAGLSSVPLSS